MPHITIDHACPFFHTGLSQPPDLLVAWKGPCDQDGLVGEEQQDARSLALTGINTDEIRFVRMLENGEEWAGTKDRFERLVRTTLIRLDPIVGVALMYEPGRVTLRRAFDDGIKTLFFPGIILRVHGLSPPPGLFILHSEDGENDWFYTMRPLVNEETIGRAFMPRLPDVAPFAVLAFT